MSAYNLENTNVTDSSSPLSFSVYFNNNYNSNGTNPPNPQFQKKTEPVYISSPTVLPSSDLLGTNPVGVIQSKREPYAVEYMFTKYGQLNTGLGTNLGAAH